MADCSGFEGVAPGYLNRLSCTTPSSYTTRVNTGGAVVDGKWFKNDATYDLTHDSTAFFRMDRIILRCSWAGFIVDLYILKGTDGSATPTALTQTSGTTYEIALYQAYVVTGGTVTLTSERTFALAKVDGSTIEAQTAGELRVKDAGITLAKMAANSIDSDQYVDGSIDTAHIGDLQVTSGKLAADAVTAGKIADGAVDITASLANDIVDDTKVGNRVPQFYRRQGGDASDWSVGGTTTYTPGAVRIQGGVSAAVSFVGGATAVITITFPVAFSQPPFVTGIAEPITGNASPLRIVQIQSTSTTQAVFGVEKRDGSSSSDTTSLHWLAIGPE